MRQLFRATIALTIVLCATGACKQRVESEAFTSESNSNEQLRFREIDVVSTARYYDTRDRYLPELRRTNPKAAEILDRWFNLARMQVAREVAAKDAESSIERSYYLNKAFSFDSTLFRGSEAQIKDELQKAEEEAARAKLNVPILREMEHEDPTQKGFRAIGSFAATAGLTLAIMTEKGFSIVFGAVTYVGRALKALAGTAGVAGVLLFFNAEAEADYQNMMSTAANLDQAIDHEHTDYMLTLKKIEKLSRQDQEAFLKFVPRLFPPAVSTNYGVYLNGAPYRGIYSRIQDMYDQGVNTLPNPFMNSEQNFGWCQYKPILGEIRTPNIDFVRLPSNVLPPSEKSELNRKGGKWTATFVYNFEREQAIKERYPDLARNSNDGALLFQAEAYVPDSVCVQRL